MLSVMLKKSLVVLGSIVFLLSGLSGTETAELELKPFSYTQDFEEKDPVEFWATNGKYTINFKGLTEEKAYSGKKSFKLDITIQEGSWHYWKIPVKVPCEGRLRLSAHILVESGNAGIGSNVAFPPTTHSGCRALSRYSPTNGEWKLIDGDLVEFGRGNAGNVPKHVWAAKPANVGVYLNTVGFFLRGGKGQRIVVYVDDVKIEGEVPDEEAYKEEIKKRWAPYEEKVKEQISSWEKTLSEREKELYSLTGLSSEAEKMKKEAEKNISSLKRKIETIKTKGGKYFKGVLGIGTGEKKGIDSSLKQLKKLILNIHAISGEGGEAGKKRMFIFVVPPITGVKILPDTPMMSIPGFISSEIKIAAAPGEYEPASFVIHALSDISSLKIRATDLKGKEGMIPLENIDIKIVKCWYQAGSAWVSIESSTKQERLKKVLVPELLLNDDSLVKVDYKEEKNYLKLSFPEEEKYVWISNPEEEKDIWGKTRKGSRILSVDKFPVKDSPKLLPVNISANTNKQIWVTVRVPDNAEEGVYEGNIILSAGKRTLAVLALKVKVLPFELSSCPIIQCLCYRGRLGRATISSEAKSELQLRREMQNMVAHGVTNPTCYQGGLTEGGLGKYLKIREETGMSKDALYYLGANINSSSSAIKNVLKFAKSYGIHEVYFWGVEEWRSVDKLHTARAAIQKVHEAGGKVFGGGGKIYFEPLGDLLDFFTLASYPDKAEAAKWHSMGHKISSYGTPQVGVENPEIYRRNYGFLLWKANYDGAQTYAYQHSFGNIWNDFDSGLRDHCFTYPTVDGVIDTIAWEGYREGVDDIRYAATLKLEIEKVKKSRRGKARKAAAEAEKYLEEMDVEGGNMDTMRMKIIDYILKLTGEE